MTKTRKFLGGAALVGIVAAGGSAFTASNSLPATTVTRGYGSQTISGVTAESVTYGMNTAEDTITSVGLVLTGDTTAKTIQVAFNDAAPATCSGTGTYASVSDDTTYSCTVSQSVGTAVKFALVAE
jgi:hypothetical protein